jgi:hypothetical protein
MNGILIGLLLAVLYCIILLPAHAGQGTNLDLTIYPILYKGMIFIPISKTQSIHLHHWMIFLGVLLFWRHLHPVVFGFSLGLFLNGISYPDWLG